MCGQTAAILTERPDEFARLLAGDGQAVRREFGRSGADRADMAYYAENAETFLAPEPIPTTNPDDGDAVVVSTPLGVILGIQPWNFPYYQLARVAAPPT